MKNLAVCIKLFVVATILTGLIYPLGITLIAQTAFYHQANGSLCVVRDKVVGSSLIAQKFDQDKYFWPRPSATDYNPLPSGGSNLSATSAQLKNTIAERKSKLLYAHPTKSAAQIPADLIYASGSGLDPHISPTAAYFQVDRVVAARQFNLAQKGEIIKLISKLTEGRYLGFLGEKRVNILRLNIALDKLH